MPAKFHLAGPKVPCPALPCPVLPRLGLYPAFVDALVFPYLLCGATTLSSLFPHSPRTREPVRTGH